MINFVVPVAAGDAAVRLVSLTPELLAIPLVNVVSGLLKILDPVKVLAPAMV